MQNNLQSVVDRDGVRIQHILRTLGKYWWLCLIFLVLSLISAHLFIRYSTPAYNVHAKILIKDNKKGAGFAGSDFFQDLDVLARNNSVDNEVELLKSRTLMEKTLDLLNLNIKYYSDGKIKQKELYFRKLPLVIDEYRITDKQFKGNVELHIDNITVSSFDVKYQGVGRRCYYYDTIRFPFGHIVFIPQSTTEKITNLLVKIHDRDNTVSELQKNLFVSPTNKTVSTIDLVLVDKIPARGEEVLNSLLSIYDGMNKEDKNKIADSTIQFIDERLQIVTGELNNVEQTIQGFRQTNELTDISSQGKLLLDNSTEYFKELNAAEVQIEVVQSLEDYLSNENNSSRLVPATFTINDPSLISLVQMYNTLQMERDREMQTTAENNPVMKRLNIQIPNLKKDILSNLATIRKGMLINRDRLKKKTEQLDREMRQVPKKERMFLEYSRQQSIKEELYLYLLKKREETAVSKAANVNNSRIVDPARSEKDPFTPKRRLIYMAAFVISIIIPVAAAYLKETFNTRVNDRAEVTERTSANILAEVGSNNLNSFLVVQEGSRSIVSEQFRVLRTNLQYLASERRAQCILVTSSMSGEGKTFIAANLAGAIALTGKRVVVVEMDLRKPCLSTLFGLRHGPGFSSYAIGKVEAGDIIVPLASHPNVWIIPSGPPPPNPSELIMSSRTEELFNILKERFDVIIVDTAPLGLVTDAQLLSRYADVSLFVVRPGYTFRQQVLAIEDLRKDNRLPRLQLVLNGVKNGKSYAYNGYAYNGNAVNKSKVKKRNGVAHV